MHTHMSQRKFAFLKGNIVYFSKILCISTRIENKVDRLTENSEQDGEVVDCFDGNMVTIHDKVNLETLLSEQSSMTVTSDYAQVRMIHDSNRPA